ncbi:MAG: phosphoglycerate kinase [Candidatus Omnitrophica bacterium CG11_big_fil_rev_8_21_14_0_20_45_26]|uniref:Phosphoglycerate kinase n=1 Tax=Candidatus Abzuiibacterium crystallinum TaxID=1974748 RepID=A0A2H0LS88_9BACT|nr:MAG: phosphoglycerate kinase [Candidatus Omnitrophica bacterium CG11_big_fil_rev_8_21_14_0_20_45_26]PIW65049.1 MAG: phosphoglycerate kinase [Candidatus Omnitrophica bacterium CG12_big_fil_rev_8_21_14_0_65_45_16]
MRKKTIQDISLEEKRVIVRVDFNVPLNEQLEITDDSRIAKTLPTIRYLIEHQARVILMSHLGRPKGKRVDKYSLLPAAKHLSKLLGLTVALLPDCVGSEVESSVKKLAPGQVVLLENLRFHPEEEKNDAAFAKQLASLAEIYVNDAFGAAHRAHASTEGIAHFLPAVSGFLMAKEITYFDAALENPKKPFVTILGGSKVSDKIKVIENLLKKVDSLLIGGAMSYTFLKAMGREVGNSKVEDENGIAIANSVIQAAKEKKVELLLPTDHVIVQKVDAAAETKIAADDIPNGWLGVDIGPKTTAAFQNVLKKAKTIIWNGPVGIFELKPFAAGTLALAKTLSESQATTIIGGGDTAAAITQFGFEGKVSHISTGGGASLEYLEGIELPGIKVLNDKEKSGVA